LKFKELDQYIFSQIFVSPICFYTINIPAEKLFSFILLPGPLFNIWVKWKLYFSAFKMAIMKILVVDDEVDVRALFEQRFRKEIRNKEMFFAFAHSGKEALDYLYGARQESIMVLSDINMPGMNGFELLQHIKDEYPKPSPVVMMISAFGDDENYSRAMKLGADDFLTKPLNFENLKEKLNLADCQ
jgi:CheY-like chemotaxis protein